jgi:hypothetical protein
MTQADRVHSTPPTNTPTTRRGFLSNTAGLAAGGTALALAIPAPAAAAFDPVFDLIAPHKKIVVTVTAIQDEIDRAVEIDRKVELEEGAFADQNSIEMGLFLELTAAVPTTLAGVVALVTYLDQINRTDPWKFEDNYATPLIGALATAFNRMAVTS